MAIINNIPLADFQALWRGQAARWQAGLAARAADYERYFTNPRMIKTMLIYVPEYGEFDWQNERDERLADLEKYNPSDTQPPRAAKPGDARGFNIVATY